VCGSSTSPSARPTSSLMDGGVVVPSGSGSSALTPTAISLAPTRPATRLQHGIHKPKSYTDSTVWYGLFTSTGEPQDHIEALSDDRWTSAMDNEMHALHKNETSHLVLHTAANVIDCK
jgi:hypothetical protein